ncbi:MAG: four-helix bundle copper-binding protein [Pseudomonadota bacterium]
MTKTHLETSGTETSPEPTVSRRGILAGVAAAGLAAPLAATAANAAHHEKHEHHAHGHAELTKIALECVGLGEACANHCVSLLAEGDTSLAKCLIDVNAMLPMCSALAHFAATDAKRLKQLAKVCITVCEDCAKECEKHADKHAECKACGESCEDCIKACKDLVDA